MKRRFLEPEVTPVPADESLCRALLSLSTPAEMLAFLRDLCTPAELEALVDRWRVVPYLLAGYAYREIHDRTSVSVTTIGRVARFLQQGNGGYLAVVTHHALPPLPRAKRGRTVVDSDSGTKARTNVGAAAKRGATTVANVTGRGRSGT